MRIIEHGTGPALVLVPGIQGRWEYARPAIDALAPFFRVLTFSLDGEHRADRPFAGPDAIDRDVARMVAALDSRQIERAVVCGISFGGLVAIRFAAEHPERTQALIVVSTPGPGWHLRPRHDLYARLPWVFGPLFLAESPFRLRRELAAALPRLGDRLRFVFRQICTALAAPISFSRMARRARLVSTLDLSDACRRITAPTLVVTGDPASDHVVSTEGTSAYAALIPGARVATIGRTGHLGTITRPRAFARIVSRFVRNVRREPDHSRVA